FRHLPFGYRFGCTFFLMFIAWCIQKYIQDWIVANSFAKIMAWMETRKKTKMMNEATKNNHHNKE
ncbi:MAG: hypothetical protein K2X39_04320, partial [Silvanigrellaceae bacterium]|nr:hypothetical protein [Silvanigrellaceae bacterium]